MRMVHMADVFDLMFEVNKNSRSTFGGRHITPFFWSQRGMGKSSEHKGYTRKRQIGFIDKRLSMVSAEEVHGWPIANREKGTMDYLPPGDLPRADLHGPRGILHLDEIARAERSVLDAAFQLVYDWQVGEYQIPEGWIISCSSNPMGDMEYQQPGISDMAMLNRFCHLRLQADEQYNQDWISYIAGQPGLDQRDVEKVVSMIAFNPDYLMTGRSTDLGFTIKPSGRSWEALLRVLEAARTVGTPKHVVYEVVAGLVGDAEAAIWRDFTLDITPDDIILGKKVKDDWEKSFRGNDGKSRQNLLALLAAISVRDITWVKNPADGKRLAGFFAWVVKRSERDLIVRMIAERPEWGDWIAMDPVLADLVPRVTLGLALPS